MTVRAWLLSSVSLAVLTLSAPALAADPYATPTGLPAVSAVNGKIDAFTGTIGDDFTLGSSGSLAFPLSGQWGGQIDGLLGTAGGGTFYGVGGHLFWRDPSKGLLGAYASYVGWGDSTTTLGNGPSGPFTDITGANVGKIGVEGEAYLGRISLEGVAAYQFGTDTGLAGKGTIAYYATDNLRLDLGVAYLQGPGGSVAAGVEWAPSGRNVSFFANASAASSDNWSAIGGVKLYLAGEQKSLIRRHREDDPDNLLPADLYKTIGDRYCPNGRLLDDDRCDGSG